ncbi:MAG: hypothetical protein P8I94_10165 [Emcibacteraceae bacterium]|nr:hypothetical protein [Emcibacteraceae bacterium]
MNKKITLITILAAFLTLTACEKSGLVIKNGPAGPNTGDLLDPLPDDLVGDKANARHSTDDLKPVIN